MSTYGPRMAAEVERLRQELRERDAALAAVLGADLPELSQVERFKRYRQWFAECQFDDYMDMLDAAIEFKTPHPPALSRDLGRRIITALYRCGDAFVNHLAIMGDEVGDKAVELHKDLLEIEAYRAGVQRDYEAEKSSIVAPINLGKMERPWSKRAEELRERHHDYADYHAWREWFTATERKLTMGADYRPILDSVEENCDLIDVDAIRLYAIFCDVFDSIPL